MKVLEVKNVGPIRHAKVDFGDLTILVGPQASGKSVFLQLLKLALDRSHIMVRMREAGLNFDFNLTDLFLGPGLRTSGDPAEGHVFADGMPVETDKAEVVESLGWERVFYIPANRSMCYTREGWIRSFSDFNASDPFTVRDFSEEVRSLLELGYRRHTTVFPVAEQPLLVQKRVSEVIFAGFQIAIDRTTPRNPRSLALL
ncbi:MAG: AAA family ATPase [Bryobacterales bacterium]|nr:AAA family ATPase [Bryobacterales bacterium]